MKPQSRTAPGLSGLGAPARRWAPFVAWLETMSRELSKRGQFAELTMCERLIAELRRSDEDDAGLAGLGAMQPVIRQCIGGTRSFLRAISAGHVELTPELRQELTEIVREIAEVIMERDLGNERAATPAPAPQPRPQRQRPGRGARRFR